VTRSLVARVVGILFGADSRVTREVIDAWTFVLDPFGDGPDALIVAGAVGRTERHPTVADYASALHDHRARRAALGPELPEPPLTDAQRDRNVARIAALRQQLAGRLTDVERRPLTRPVPRRLDEDHYRRLAEADEDEPFGRPHGGVLP
jgi:hypothetical protein